MNKIRIKPENRGKFNATKKRTGKTTEELTHSKNPLTRKRAIFAQNAKKWKHQDGGNITNPEYEAMTPIITFLNRDKNFVQRAMNPELYPYILAEDGRKKTHLMEYSTFDDGYARVYPTIVQKSSGNLEELNSDDAYNYATNTDEYIDIPNIPFAKWYSENGLINHIKKQKGGIRVDPLGVLRKGHRYDPVIIPGDEENGTEITMVGVDKPIYAKDNKGSLKLMIPGFNYHFDGSYVTEYPLKAQSGSYFNPNSDTSLKERFKDRRESTNVIDARDLFKNQSPAPIEALKYLPTFFLNTLGVENSKIPIFLKSQYAKDLEELERRRKETDKKNILKHQTNPYIDLDTFSYNNKTYGNNRKFNMDNMKLLDEYFIGKGVPLNQRQAILFNVLQESGADTLDAHGNGYYGIMGWSKDRYDSIKDKSLLGQAEYLYNTLYNGNGSADWNHGGKGSGYNSWTDAKNMFINGKTFDDINHALIHGYIRPSSDVRNYRTTNGAVYFQPKKLEGSFVPLPTVDNKITDYSRAMAKGLFEGNNIANIVGTTLGAASTLAASIGGAVRAKKQGNADVNQDALEHNGATLENEVQLEHPERAMRTDNEVQIPYSSPLIQKLGSPIPFRYSWNQQGGMPSTQAIIEGGEIVDYPDGTQLIDTGEQHEYSGERTYRPDGKIDGDPVEFTGIPIVDLKNNPNLKLLSFGANPWAQGEPFIWPSTVNQHGYVNTMVDRYFPEAHNKNELKSIFNQPYYYPQKMKLKRSAKKSFGGKMQLGLTTPQVNFFAQKQKLSPQAQMQYDAWANAVIEDSKKKEPTTWDNIKDKAKEVANWLVYDDTRGKTYAQQPYTLNDYYQDKKQIEENALVPLRYMANAATYLNPATSIPATILDIVSAPKEDMDEMFTRVPTDIVKGIVKNTATQGWKGLGKSLVPLMLYPFANRFYNTTSEVLTGKNIEQNLNAVGAHPKLSHTMGTFAGGMTAGRLAEGYSANPKDGRLNMWLNPFEQFYDNIKFIEKANKEFPEYNNISKWKALSTRLTNNAVRNRIAEHNTYVRGVRDTEDVNDIVAKELGKKPEDVTSDDRLIFMATHYAPDTKHGRLGFENLPQGLGTIYTSNSLDTGFGYANINSSKRKVGNEKNGKVAIVRRPYTLGENRWNWFKEGNNVKLINAKKDLNIYSEPRIIDLYGDNINKMPKNLRLEFENHVKFLFPELDKLSYNEIIDRKYKEVQKVFPGSIKNKSEFEKNLLMNFSNKKFDEKLSSITSSKYYDSAHKIYTTEHQINPKYYKTPFWKKLGYYLLGDQYFLAPVDNFYQHYNFIGPINQKGLDFVRFVSPEEWNGFKLTRAHEGYNSPGLSRKQFQLGGLTKPAKIKRK